MDEKDEKNLFKTFLQNMWYRITHVLNKWFPETANSGRIRSGREERYSAEPLEAVSPGPDLWDAPDEGEMQLLPGMESDYASGGGLSAESGEKKEESPASSVSSAGEVSVSDFEHSVPEAVFTPDEKKEIFSSHPHSQTKDPDRSGVIPATDPHPQMPGEKKEIFSSNPHSQMKDPDRSGVIPAADPHPQLAREKKEIPGKKIWPVTEPDPSVVRTTFRPEDRTVRSGSGSREDPVRRTESFQEPFRNRHPVSPTAQFVYSPEMATTESPQTSAGISSPEEALTLYEKALLRMRSSPVSPGEKNSFPGQQEAEAFSVFMTEESGAAPVSRRKSESGIYTNHFRDYSEFPVPLLQDGRSVQMMLYGGKRAEEFLRKTSVSPGENFFSEGGEHKSADVLAEKMKESVKLLNNINSSCENLKQIVMEGMNI